MHQLNLAGSGDRRGKVLMYRGLLVHVMKHSQGRG